MMRLRVPFTHTFLSREYDDLFQCWNWVIRSEEAPLSERDRRTLQTSEDPDDHLTLAVHWLTEDRPEAAIEECQTALRLFASWKEEIWPQTEASAYLWMGEAFLALGQLSHARDAWEQASALDIHGIGDHARKRLVEYPVHGTPPPHTFLVIVVDGSGAVASRHEFHEYAEAADTFAKATRRIRKERLCGVGFVERHPIGCIERLAIKPSEKRHEREEFRRVFFSAIGKPSST